MAGTSSSPIVVDSDDSLMPRQTPSLKPCTGIPANVRTSCILALPSPIKLVKRKDKYKYVRYMVVHVLYNNCIIMCVYYVTDRCWLYAVVPSVFVISIQRILGHTCMVTSIAVMDVNT